MLILWSSGINANLPFSERAEIPTVNWVKQIYSQETVTTSQRLLLATHELLMELTAAPHVGQVALLVSALEAMDTVAQASEGMAAVPDLEEAL